MSDDQSTAEMTDASGEGDVGFRQWREHTRETLQSADSGHVAVYVRSMLPPHGAKESQVDVIRNLERATGGTPLEVTVEVWGERLCLCDACRETDVGRFLTDRVKTLESWGEEFGASTSDYFDWTQHDSFVTGNTYQGIVPPRVTAALYVDGSVEGVFPCRFGENCYTPAEFAETLEELSVTTATGAPETRS